MSDNYNRDEAVKLLQHYFALAMGHKRGYDLNSDYRAEIASIVDFIIDAAKAELKAELNQRIAALQADVRKLEAGQ